MPASRPPRKGESGVHISYIINRTRTMLYLNTYGRHCLVPPPILKLPLLAQWPRFFTRRREYGIKGANGAEGARSSLGYGPCRENRASGPRVDAD